jgi:hypothetical protein
MIMNQNLNFLETMAGALATGRRARVDARVMGAIASMRIEILGCSNRRQVAGVRGCLPRRDRARLGLSSGAS